MQFSYITRRTRLSTPESIDRVDPEGRASGGDRLQTTLLQFPQKTKVHTRKMTRGKYAGQPSRYSDPTHLEHYSTVAY